VPHKEFVIINTKKIIINTLDASKENMDYDELEDEFFDFIE
jgi:hypothetical protein